MKLKMSKGDLQAFLTAEFPQVDGKYMIQDLAPLQITVRMTVTEANLRPGGTISGPSMFALADISMYLAILAMIGPQALAVTTNCSIDFMRKPRAGAGCRAASPRAGMAGEDCPRRAGFAPNWLERSVRPFGPTIAFVRRLGFIRGG